MALARGARLESPSLRKSVSSCFFLCPCRARGQDGLHVGGAAMQVPIKNPRPTFEEEDEEEWARKSPSPTFEEEEDAEDPDSESGKKTSKRFKTKFLKFRVHCLHISP